MNTQQKLHILSMHRKQIQYSSVSFNTNIKATLAKIVGKALAYLGAIVSEHWLGLETMCSLN